MIYPNIDPIAFHLGPIAVRWYGLAYAAGFMIVMTMGRRSIQRNAIEWITLDHYERVMCGLMLGLVLGGRVGYMLMYQFDRWWAHPLSVFKVWEGGMSFHGALIGCLTVLIYQSYRYDFKCLALSDLIVPWVPCGLGLGRLANFINGELWGRPTDQTWGMIFPWVDAQLRHPSQLYEFFLEGVVLFVMIYLMRPMRTQQGQLTGLFLGLYGIMRFSVEFFRMPDPQIGFLLNTQWLTMGQCLSIPMIVIGVILFFRKTLPASQA